MKTYPVSPLRGNDGFTLLEVMVSLAILAFGILGVVGMFTTSIGGNAQGRHVTEATNHAQAKLDEYINTGDYDSLAPDSTTIGIYTITSTLSEPVPAIGANLKKITVTASWTTMGHVHTLEFSGMRSKN